MQPRLVESLNVRFFGRIQKRICDLRSYVFFTTKRTEDPKKYHLPWGAKVCPRAPRGKKKNNKLIQTAKTRRRKSNKLRMNKRNVYISI